MISIFKKKNEGAPTRTHLEIKNLKKLFDMVKGTKSNPVSKRDGVKNEFAFNYQSVTNITLTAMPYTRGPFDPIQ
jgi:CDP-glycerol glycerophosphotransferase (TagB/SpsB family)